MTAPALAIVTTVVVTSGASPVPTAATVVVVTVYIVVAVNTVNVFLATDIITAIAKAIYYRALANTFLCRYY